MRPGVDGYAGPGIYFADNPRATGWKARQRGTILSCKVALGRVQDTNYPLDWSDPATWHAWLWPNYDTIRVTSLHGHEYVVYQPERILCIRWHSGLRPKEPPLYLALFESLISVPFVGEVVLPLLAVVFFCAFWYFIFLLEQSGWLGLIGQIVYYTVMGVMVVIAMAVVLALLATGCWLLEKIDGLLARLKPLIE
jgi:hypothetical protein